jgi:hypothetical protein
MHRVAWIAILLASTANAVELPEAVRIPNWGGYCTWACLGTLAKRHGWPYPVQNIMREVWTKNGQLPAYAGYDHRIERELQAAGVLYLMRPQFSYDRTLLEHFAESHGVQFAFAIGTPGIGCHSCVCVSYGPDVVKYYDPNRPKTIMQVDRAFFDRWWLGSSVVILPPNPTGAE